MSKRLFFWWRVVVVAVVYLAVALPMVLGLHFLESGASANVCWEDDPCWDCSTMGNLQCGPSAPPADDWWSHPGDGSDETIRPELFRTGIWWPCWAVDVPCSVSESTQSDPTWR